MKTRTEMRSLKAVSLRSSADDVDLLVCSGADVAADGAPTDVDMLVEASYSGHRSDGSPSRWTVTAEDIDACVAHFKARRERHPGRLLVVDYEHQTLADGEAPAAGWISDLYAIVRDGKKVLRAKIESWTLRAAEYIKNKEYRYISPVFVQGASDKETGTVERLILINAGLTNEPLIDDLLPLVAKHLPINVPGKDTIMDGLLERLRWFLNIPVTATVEDCVTELNKLITQVQEGAGATAEVTAKDLRAFFTTAREAIVAKGELIGAIGGKPETSAAEAKVLIIAARDNAAQVATLNARVLQLETEKFESAFGAIIAKAFSEGKILPTQQNDAAWLKGQRDFATADLAKFETHWNAQPKIAPIGTVPTGGNVNTAKGITPDDVAVANVFGIKEDLLKKHNATE